MSTRTKSRLKSLRRPDTPDDTLSATQIADIETTAADFDAFLDAVLSQIKRMIHGNKAGDWFEDPTDVDLVNLNRIVFTNGGTVVFTLSGDLVLN